MEFLGFLNAAALSASVIAVLASLLTKILARRKDTKFKLKIGDQTFVLTIDNEDDVKRVVDEIQKASPSEQSTATTKPGGPNGR
jgi:hypothetical protein